MTVTVREERGDDTGRIREINLLAFGHGDEADIVERLRESCPKAISLVAEVDNRLVGRILFTPVVIESPSEHVYGMGLAPMSVLPEFQGQGIGSKLVETGLRVVEAVGTPFVVVIGHLKYYPRFGFSWASLHRITSEYEDVPDEAFMIVLFDGSALKDKSSVAKYHPALASV